MDKTMLNAQLFTTGLNCVFLSRQICWLWKIRSVEKIWFGCQWKQWLAWFCCLLDLSSGIMSGASFFNFFYSFQQLKYAEYVVRCFKLVARILYCNFFLLYMRLLSSRQIAQNIKVLFKKHALELFQYSYALFDNRFELNSDLKQL